MNESAVCARGVVKRYGAKEVLRGVDLTVPTGSVVAVLGPNGAGKTTLIEILEGLRSRTSGSVDVLGVDPGTAPRRWRDRLGVVLQGNGDHRGWTVTTVVSEFARYYSQPRDPGEVLRDVGLEEHSRARVEKLSGGLRRRLDIALGIIGRPELLFLDEPTTGFDPEIRRSFWKLIGRINAEGATVILTSHYLDEVEALADHVVVLTEGTVAASGKPDDIGLALHLPSRVTWRQADGDYSVETDRPDEFVKSLPDGVIADGSLSVRRPSLEDRYLALIGATDVNQ
ncbi:ABC transporter ATP-binding protein [Rathayibacter toxicus]|uniref:ABC transporter ATP-binding protein n=1 Tax=Rathayibacter toxicus TaxID=145458 RepID=UPI001C0530BA|nr:ABC transporter ATP-binding protein [Rathayibacter toxicus]QWL30902.1 ABC transporter ATP-binding protein [Rathayibacter toxicus]